VRIAYAIERATNALVIIGSVVYNEHNDLHVTFEPSQLERIGAGELRPFVLLGDKALRAWPLMPSDLVSHRPTTTLRAAPKQRAPDRRPQVWEGWPLLERDGALVVALQDYGEPLPTIAAILLRPLVPVDQLGAYEAKQDGFGIGYKDGPSAPAPRVTPIALPDDEDDVTSAELAEAHAEPANNPSPDLDTPAPAETTKVAEPQADPPSQPPEYSAPASGCRHCPPGCDLGCDGAMHCADHCAPVLEALNVGGPDGGVEPEVAGGREGVQPVSDQAGDQRPVLEAGAGPGRSDGLGARRRRGRRPRGDDGAPVAGVPEARPGVGGDPVDGGRAEPAPPVGGDAPSADGSGAGEEPRAPEPAAPARAPGSESVRAGVPDAAPEPPSAGLGKPRRRVKRENKQTDLFAWADAKEAATPAEDDADLPEPKPPLPPGAEACAICGRAVEAARTPGEGRQCARQHYLGSSRVPARIVKSYGPSPAPPLRVRALGTCGLRFVTAGDIFLGERCPTSPETSVWIVAPDGSISEGVSYRLNAGEWESEEPPPTPRRAARGLDDL
jgi:hypothetical protein